MLLDSRAKERPAGIVVDRGTGRRIPFVVWFDAETGDYEALSPAPNGTDILAGPDGRAKKYRGRSVGKLELLPFGSAALVGQAPKIVTPKVEVVTDEQKHEGLETYCKLFRDVWQYRGEPRRKVLSRWEEYLEKNDFLDDFVVKR